MHSCPTTVSAFVVVALLAQSACCDDSSDTEVYKSTLLDAAAAAGAQQAADDQFFSRDFPHGSVSETTLRKHEDGDFRIYRNLWYHSSRFYSIHSSATLAANKSNINTQLSMNLGLIAIPVEKPSAHFRNIQAAWLKGTTLLIDQPYPASPDNMGYWSELLLPLYSMLSSDAWKQQGVNIDSVLFANMNRDQLERLHWVWEMLKLVVAPAVAPGVELPRVVFYNDFGYLDRKEWLCIQTSVLINERALFPKARLTFWSPQLGRSFRDAVYKRHGIKQSWPASNKAPRTITVLTNAGSVQIANQQDLLAALQDIGHAFGYKVRPLSITSGAPFQSYVAAMARTGVLVARHGPLLANSMFLLPGAAVVELLPFNWQWNSISELYRNITTSLGDVNHVVWRADSMQWAAYASVDDQRYGTWTAEECASQYCMDVHAKASMVVDIPSVSELIVQTLQAMIQGGGGIVAGLRQFPKAV